MEPYLRALKGRVTWRRGDEIWGEKLNRKLKGVMSLNMAHFKKLSQAVQQRWYHSKIYPRYAPDMPEICPRYAQDMPEICARDARDSHKICPRYAQDMPEKYAKKKLGQNVHYFYASWGKMSLGHFVLGHFVLLGKMSWGKMSPSLILTVNWCVVK